MMHVTATVNNFSQTKTFYPHSEEYILCVTRRKLDISFFDYTKTKFL